MNNRPVYQVIIMYVLSSFLGSCSNTQGHLLPDAFPDLFENGYFSTELNELNSTFSPDGKIFLYTIANNSTSNTFYTIFQSKKTRNGWTRPVIAPFSGTYSDADPFFSPDGKKVFFISVRPISPKSAVKTDFDIWYVDMEDNTFGSPKHLSSNVNSELDELYPSVSSTGSLYFSRSNGANGYDIMVSKKVDGTFAAPDGISDSINTPLIEYDAYVSPDESYVIYTSIGGDTSYGSGDLYISFFEDGSWSRGENLGPSINSAFMDQCPAVSPDGKWLYFSSFRDNEAFRLNSRMSTDQYYALLHSPYNGLANIYRVEASSILGRNAKAK